MIKSIFKTGKTYKLNPEEIISMLYTYYKHDLTIILKITSFAFIITLFLFPWSIIDAFDLIHENHRN